MLESVPIDLFEKARTEVTVNIECGLSYEKRELSVNRSGMSFSTPTTSTNATDKLGDFGGIVGEFGGQLTFT
jgi:hypothetical protein